MDTFASLSEGLRPVLENGIYKSPYDIRHYKYHKLENGIKILIISDFDENNKNLPKDESVCEDYGGSEEESIISIEKNMASVAVCVHSGSMQDPHDIPGLSHFLEHLLFMGSNKYPEASEFGNYITENGGYTNAYTSFEHTNYFIRIPLDFLEESLDRFVQFFISPLLDESTVDKERIAVDNEYQNLKLNEHFRQTAILQTTMHKNHIASKFSIGNLVSLKENIEKQGINLRERVFEHWKKFYASKIMTVAVYIPAPLEDFEKSICDLISNIPFKNNSSELSQMFDWRDVFNKAQFNKIIAYKSLKNTQSVTLLWTVPSQIKLYKTKPFHFLSHLFGHEGHGSILSYLIEKSLAFELCAGLSLDETMNNHNFAVFQISIDLVSTENILNDEKTLFHIISVIFAYIKILKRETDYKSVFREFQVSMILKFLLEHMDHPDAITSKIASKMNEYDPEFYLIGDSYAFDYNEKEIRDCIDLLTFENLSILIGATHSLDNNKIESWFNIPYIYKDYPNSWLNNIENCVIPSQITLPTSNIFLPTNLVRAINDFQPTELPKLIEQNDRYRLFYMYDTEFNMPECNIEICIHQNIDNYPKIQILNSFFAAALNYLKREMLYEAEMGDIKTKFEQTHMSVILLKIEGYEEKIDIFVKALFENYLNFEISEHQFEEIKLKIIQENSNCIKKQRKLRKLLLVDLLVNHGIKIFEKFEEIKKISYAEFIDFKKALPYMPVFIDIMFCGCISLKKSHSILQNILINLNQPSLSLENISREKYVKIPYGSAVYRQLSFEETDQQMSILNIYQFGKISFEIFVEIKILNYFLNPFAFEILRDVEQLGYEVGSNVIFDINIPSLIIIVVSDVNKNSNNFIDDRIEEIIKKFLEKLKNLNEEEFQKKIKSYIKRETQVDANLGEKSLRLFSEILFEKFMFDRKNKKAEYAKKVTKDSLIKLVETYLINKSSERRKLSIQIIGRGGNCDKSMEQTNNFDRVLSRTDEIKEEY